jgi:hypothetical protein
MSKETPAPFQPEFERDEDFVSLYSNHVWFESSAWDLNLVFGQLDLSKGPNVVRQHTAIALSWMQAKLLAHYIEVNILIHEGKDGEVQIPPYLRPPEIPPLTPEEEKDPAKRETNKRLRELRQRFLENL